MLSHSMEMNGYKGRRFGLPRTILSLDICPVELIKHPSTGDLILLCPVDQEGVEMRPIEMLSGESDFNETFFTNARTSKENVVGEVN